MPDGDQTRQLAPCTCDPLHREFMHFQHGRKICKMSGCRCQGFKAADLSQPAAEPLAICTHVLHPHGCACAHGCPPTLQVQQVAVTPTNFCIMCGLHVTQHPAGLCKIG